MPGIDPNIVRFLENPPVVAVLAVWTLFWKGLALWNAARNNQRNWFITLLVLSTLGVLDIIYLKFYRVKRK